MNIKEIVSKMVRECLNEAFVDNDGKLQDLPQKDINEILRGYIECALWTEEERLNDQTSYDDGGDYDEEEYDDMDDIEKLIRLKGKLDKKDFKSFASEDIDIDSRIDAYNDIKTFIKNAGDDAIQEAIDGNGLFKLGMDIWFTRNGHGSGFFDHSYDNEEILIKAGQNLNSKELYVGDNGKLYFI